MSSNISNPLKLFALLAGMCLHIVLLHLPVLALLGTTGIHCMPAYFLFLLAMALFFLCDSCVPASPVFVTQDRLAYRGDILPPILGLVILALHVTCLYQVVQPVQRLSLVGMTISGAMIAGGLSLRFLAIRQLGDFFTTDLQVLKVQPLVTTGVYAAIRHPSYAGMLLLNLGLTMLAQGLVTWCVWLLLAPLVVRRVLNEEAAMSAGFAGYADYMRKSKRLIPYVF